MTQQSGPAFDGLYGQMIMDHYRTPRNRDPLADPTLAAYELNPFCGDLIDLKLHLDDHGAVDGVSAHSDGCSIIQASASLMSEAVKGMTVPEIEALAARFRIFMRPAAGYLAPPADLGDLHALGVVKQYPVRIKCALLPWTALEEAIARRAPAPLTSLPPFNLNPAEGPLLLPLAVRATCTAASRRKT